jgi:hypothetical protein
MIMVGAKSADVPIEAVAELSRQLIAAQLKHLLALEVPPKLLVELLINEAADLASSSPAITRETYLDELAEQLRLKTRAFARGRQLAPARPPTLIRN